MMLADLITPDLEVSLHLDPYAPRAARHHVGLIDRPSPDLRAAVTLLTSELVSHAVQRCGDGPPQDVRLRAWMPEDVVRVEIRAPRELLDWPEDDGAEYEVLLLDRLADRWSIDTEDPLACMWFEIDRHLGQDDSRL
jgi:hypothetical protein